MDEYIKRHDALNALYRTQLKGKDADEAVQHLMELPAADVQPVRHGRWVNTDDFFKCGFEVFACSACGIKDKGLSNFCPFCGAKMDAEEDAR